MEPNQAYSCGAKFSSKVTEGGSLTEWAAGISHSQPAVEGGMFFPDGTLAKRWLKPLTLSDKNQIIW